MLLKIPFYTVKMFLIIYTMHLNDFVVNKNNLKYSVFVFNKAKMVQLMYICLTPSLNLTSRKPDWPNNLNSFIEFLW